MPGFCSNPFMAAIACRPRPSSTPILAVQRSVLKKRGQHQLDLGLVLLRRRVRTESSKVCVRVELKMSEDTLARPNLTKLLAQFLQTKAKEKSDGRPVLFTSIRVLINPRTGLAGITALKTRAAKGRFPCWVWRGGQPKGAEGAGHQTFTCVYNDEQRVDNLTCDACGLASADCSQRFACEGGLWTLDSPWSEEGRTIAVHQAVAPVDGRQALTFTPVRKDPGTFVVIGHVVGDSDPTCSAWCLVV